MHMCKDVIVVKEQEISIKGMKCH